DRRGRADRDEFGSRTRRIPPSRRVQFREAPPRRALRPDHQPHRRQDRGVSSPLTPTLSPQRREGDYCAAATLTGEERTQRPGRTSISGSPGRVARVSVTEGSFARLTV